MAHSAAPLTTFVRITRTHSVKIVEFVDVQLCRNPEDAKGIPDNDVALDLVKAKEAAGEDLAWFVVSERPADYNHTTYFAEVSPANPATES